MVATSMPASAQWHPSPAGLAPTDIAAGAGAVWIGNGSSRLLSDFPVSVSRIDPASSGFSDDVVVSCYTMLTVPDAARRAGRDPETIRRWIRSGRLRARKIGTQHVIDEADLELVLVGSDLLPLPAPWTSTRSGRRMPNVAAALGRSRSGR